MDEPLRDQQALTPNLASAVRRARIEQADHTQVVAELRGAEIARLEMLKAALEPVMAQVPEGIDMFDMGLMPGEKPRLFIDMIGFVEMGRDRRQYRFMQDTRYGRLTVVETERLETMTEAVTGYVARRLVEREKALASDRTVEEAARAFAAENQPEEALSAPAPDNDVLEPAAPVAVASAADAPRRRGVVATAFLFIIELLGAIVLLTLLAAGGYVAWRYGLVWWAANHPAP